LLARIRHLHQNETGAEEGMNKLLIFALVAIPLIMLLIYFGRDIITKAQEQFGTVMGEDIMPGGSGS
jgi:hypothetical protein